MAGDSVASGSEDGGDMIEQYIEFGGSDENVPLPKGGILSGANLRTLLISADAPLIIIGFWLKKVLSK